MGEVLTVYLGDVLGLYRALQEGGSMTSGELANAARIHERYASEWLEQQAAAGILTAEDASAAGRRPPVRPAGRARRAAARPESPYSIAPYCKSFVAMAGAMPHLRRRVSARAGRCRGRPTAET
jgi:hypothetical protein